MPKLIDTEQRRRDYADAVFRVMTEDGYAAVSVRSVAAAAGVSVGSLRHLFPSQDALLKFAMEESARRLTLDIRDVSTKDSPLDYALAMLSHLLPTTPQRRIYAEVWLGFVIASMHRDSLDEVRTNWYDQARGFFYGLLVRLQNQGVLREGLDLDWEAERLHMLVDGATLHDTTEGHDHGLQMLRRHLESLG